MNLAVNASDWFEAAHQWSDRYVGATTPPEAVPEPSTVLGVLALSALGAASRWKRPVK